MAKVRLNIQELKRQQADLKRYRRFLPTLVLKKLLIQLELNRAKRSLDETVKQEKDLMDWIHSWVAVMGEEAGITEMLRIESVETGMTNVAGVEVPVFKGIRFKKADYDLYTTPLWVDKAMEALKHVLTIRAEVLTIRQQIERLKNEWRRTIKRVNLFEKIKIPQTVENIRVIQIFLADQEAAAIVRGKLAKIKISHRATALQP
jgi:V/A-type H+-transporting ATPase subunit D